MSLVDQVRKLEQQVTDRLRELEPLTREYEQLRKTAQRLGLKYSPRSTRGRAEAKPPATARAARARAGAAARAAAEPKGTQGARSSASGGASKAAAKPGRARSSAGPRTTRTAASRASGSAAAATEPTRTARRQPSRGRRAPAARPGQRHEEVLRLVGENPGITVREIGERLGIDATGLYRVVNRLTADGRLRKDGPRLHAIEPAAAADQETAEGSPEAGSGAETGEGSSAPEPGAATPAAADTRTASQ